eukprot:GEMP01018506.1.p1 GENE.GEMP01018506.1~~GEMP01018506.1.p1  ORF type:complete len:720 (+),score=125.91 GEMP01018506.1:105-2264(+)
MLLTGTEFSPDILDLALLNGSADENFGSQVIKGARPARPPPPGVRRIHITPKKVPGQRRTLLVPMAGFDALCSTATHDGPLGQDTDHHHNVQQPDGDFAVNLGIPAWRSFCSSVKCDIATALSLKFQEIGLVAKAKGNSELRKKLDDFVETILDGFGNFLDTYGVTDENVTDHRVRAVESYCKRLSAQVLRLTLFNHGVEEKLVQFEAAALKHQHNFTDSMNRIRETVGVEAVAFAEDKPIDYSSGITWSEPEEQIRQLQRSVVKKLDDLEISTQKHSRVNDELLEWIVRLEAELARAIQKLGDAREEGGISVQKFLAALKTEKCNKFFYTEEESPYSAEQLEGSRNERLGSAVPSRSRPPSRNNRSGEKFLQQQQDFSRELSAVGDDLMRIMHKSQRVRGEILTGSCEESNEPGRQRLNNSFSGSVVQLNMPVFPNEEMSERAAIAKTGRDTVLMQPAGEFNKSKMSKRKRDSLKKFHPVTKSVIARRRSLCELSGGPNDTARSTTVPSNSRLIPVSKDAVAALPSENSAEMGGTYDNAPRTVTKRLEDALKELENVKAQLAEVGITIEEEQIVLPARAEAILEIAGHTRNLLHADREDFAEQLTICRQKIEQAMQKAETKRLRKTCRVINGILHTIARAVGQHCGAALSSPVVRTQLRQLNKHYERLISVKFWRTSLQVGDALNLSDGDNAADDCIRIHFDDLAGGSNVKNFLHSFV